MVDDITAVVVDLRPHVLNGNGGGGGGGGGGA
jgi:hypothetical protein